MKARKSAARKRIEKTVRRLGLFDYTMPFEKEVANRLRADRKKAKKK